MNNKQWSTSLLTEDFKEKFNWLHRLPRDVILKRWTEAGSKHIALFGLSWNHTGNWIRIDNYNAFTDNEQVFSITIDPYFLTLEDQADRKKYYEQVAVVLAIEVGMQEYRMIPIT